VSASLQIVRSLGNLLSKPEAIEPPRHATAGLPEAARVAQSILVSGQHNAAAAPKKSAPPPDAARMIRAWRHRSGLTQEALAHTLGVTFSTVSRWENSHVRPSSLAWKALVQVAVERGTPLADDHNSALPVAGLTH